MQCWSSHADDVHVYIPSFNSQTLTFVGMAAWKSTFHVPSKLLCAVDVKGITSASSDQRPVVLEFVDREIVEALLYHLHQLGVAFRLGEQVTEVGIDEKLDFVFAKLESGQKVHADALIYAAGLSTDSRGKLKVNEFFQTDISRIYVADTIRRGGLAWGRCGRREALVRARRTRRRGGRR
jgi:hypothetical protein